MIMNYVFHNFLNILSVSNDYLSPLRYPRFVLKKTLLQNYLCSLLSSNLKMKFIQTLRKIFKLLV